MGTSTARQAPGGKLWRTAKTSMARFTSGKEASPPQVKEVVAHYLTALQADYGEAIDDTAFLPAMARTVASLENFFQHWQQHGWEKALASLGLNPASRHNGEEVMPALLDRLAGPGDTLPEAVTRAALADHFYAVLSSGYDPAAPSADSDYNDSLRTFLGLALYRKLLSDLGESVEFHAPTIARGLERLEEIRSYFLTGVKAVGSAGPTAAFSSEEIRTVLNSLLTSLGGPHAR